MLEQVVHLVHIFGELSASEQVAFSANSMFACSLAHGGVVYVRRRIRCHRIHARQVRAVKAAARMGKIAEP